MQPDTKESGAPPVNAASSDWESRRLCSDGNCIGVIGADGRCKVCGKPCTEEEMGPQTVGEAPAEAPPEETAAAEPAPAGPPAGESEGDWESRRLCSDGNCIGVIGADGRCKVCGKPYAEG